VHTENTIKTQIIYSVKGHFEWKHETLITTTSFPRENFDQQLPTDCGAAVVSAVPSRTIARVVADVIHARASILASRRRTVFEICISNSRHHHLP